MSAKLINRTLNNNPDLRVDGTLHAKVNGIDDVSVGLPVGAITMWYGVNPPDNWLLCDGSIINLDSQDNPSGNNGAIGGVNFDSSNENELGTLVGVISRLFYKVIAEIIPEPKWIGSGHQEGSNFIIESYVNNESDALELNNTSIENFYYGSVSFSNLVTVTKYYRKYLPDLQQRFPLGALSGGMIGKDGHTSSSQGYATDLGSIGGEDTNTLETPEMPSHTHNLQYAGYSIGGGTDAELLRTMSNLPTPTSSTGGGEAHNNIPSFLAVNFIIKYK